MWAVVSEGMLAMCALLKGGSGEEQKRSTSG